MLTTLVALWVAWGVSFVLFAFALPIAVGVALVASGFILVLAKRRLRR
ncbi:MAG: hypothetical protein ACLQBB_02170 [Solirubrobacteraceae bacterium]